MSDKSLKNFKFNKKYNFIFAMGLFCLLAGVSIWLRQIFRGITDNSILLPVIMFAVGELNFFLCFTKYRKTLILACGFMFILDGILLAIIILNIFSVGLKNLWPLFMIFGGLSLIPADLCITKKIHSVYLFPGLSIIFIGFLFFLFSMNIIAISFSSFISVFLPLLCIIAGISLIVIFSIQKRHSMEFPYFGDDLENEDY